MGHFGFEIAMEHAGRSQEAVASLGPRSGEGAGLEQVRSPGTQMVTKASGTDYISQGSSER